MLKIKNLTNTHIKIKDMRKREIILPPNGTKVFPDRELVALRTFARQGLISVNGAKIEQCVAPVVVPANGTPVVASVNGAPIVAGFDFEALRNKKLVRMLVMPGIGDIHWAILKIESMIRVLNIARVIIDVWSPDGRPRGMELIKRLPFVSVGKYVMHSPFPDHKSSYSKDADKHLPSVAAFAHMYDGEWIASPSPEHDVMLCFNGALGNGRRIDNGMLPQFSVNWNYNIQMSAKEEAFGRQYGRYVLVFVSDLGGFARWLPLFPEKQIKQLLLDIKRRYGCQIILSGSQWDHELNTRLNADGDFINLVGKTDFGELLGLIKNSLAFVGFCGGNTMMSVHFKKPTIMLWNGQDPSLSNAKFWVAWAPSDASSYYRPTQLDLIDLSGTILSELKSLLPDNNCDTTSSLRRTNTLVGAPTNDYTIKTGTGIGDILWIIMKMEATGERFHWQMSSEPPKRGHQIFEALPQTVLSVSYSSKFNTAQVAKSNIIHRFKTWSAIKASGEKELFVLINSHFETVPSGNINGWLPDLKVNYHPQYQTQGFVGQANEMFWDKNAKYVGCYGSTYATARYWGGWQDDAWADFILKLRQYDPSIVPVIIGATWDTDMATNLMKRLNAQSVPYVKVIGENLCLVIELMKRLSYGFYFPSGLACIAGTLDVPATMWYPKHLNTMRGQWCDPALTASDTFHEIPFCSPEDMFRYIESHKKILR